MTPFSLFIALLYIHPRLKDIKDNYAINMYNIISKEILKMELVNLNKGIWNILSKYKNNNFDLTKYGFKEYYTVLQHLEIMKNNKFFCIEYEVFKGCSTPNCTLPKKIKEFFSP